MIGIDIQLFGENNFKSSEFLFRKLEMEPNHRKGFFDQDIYHL